MIDLLKEDLKHSEEYKDCLIEVWRDNRRGCYLCELYVPGQQAAARPDLMVLAERHPYADITTAIAKTKEQIDKYYTGKKVWWDEMPGY
ncbi:hypothetical protein [Nostoc sp. 'Peltigera malacea cyanobiont' DB3992]|uniref:hypothetical protein n=1 Tax=Nostoc sp. 'Peltigera malacea cyanobiont' DB3992 TaxID=1206980 RepID=UPI000C049AAB|nr:hypothetical protein [Nostoc sp. 'Peltigera malacea cyanobiont' DB3992]PHM07388.1 hypothetical protein CK516_27335 [Nostoc sp. 'Peltigera malacea cyanobiont' DB3992]